MHIDYPSYLLRKEISCSSHIKNSIYENVQRTQKLIKQFLNQVEYQILQSACMVCVKTMRDMTANCKMDIENNVMHVNPKHK